MVKLKDPMRSSEARGRIGGTQYNTWRGIRYAKINSGPGTYNNPKQAAMLHLGHEAAKHWGTLTQAIRDEWTHYADDHRVSDWTGSPIRWTGCNWYVKCSVGRARYAQGYPTHPPSRPAPPLPENLTFIYYPELSQWICNFSNWPGIYADCCVLELWRLIWPNAGRQMRIEQARFSRYLTYDPGGTSDYPDFPGWWSLWFRSLDTETGLPGPWDKRILPVEV